MKIWNKNSGFSRIQRPTFTTQIARYFRTHPIVALLGPRQCGKTTLARLYAGDISKTHYFDLESTIDLARLQNPFLTLQQLSGLIIIDEIQRLPDLFTALRVLVDEPDQKRQFLILGSASRELIWQSSESLAGRIAFIELTPFSYPEAGELQRLWLRGGYPRSFLAATDAESFDWRTFYIRTFLEQDLPSFGVKIAPDALRRFWMMITHYHGNILNTAELARSFGVSDKTIRHYLDILSGTFMVRQLQPWHENIGKRQVKSPKLYFRDSGLLHALLDLHSSEQLWIPPKMGASWEGFALEEVVRFFGKSREECYFWSTHSGAEIDLLFQKQGERLGFEFKYSDAPTTTRSMQIALRELSLDKFYVIYPGTVDYPLTEQIAVRGLENFLRATPP